MGAFLPLASSSIGELGADLLWLRWICAAMAVHAAEVCDEVGAVPMGLSRLEDSEEPPLPAHEEQVPCGHL